MDCPRCGKNLVQKTYRNTVAFVCPDGCGRYITFAGLRNCGASRELLNDLWSNAKNGNSIPGIPCPNCNRLTQSLKLGNDQVHFDLDVCTICQALWFDSGELEYIPMPDEPVKTIDKSELENLEPITSGYDHLPDGDEPDQFWKYLPAILGLPVEQYSTSLRRLPIFTWGIALICITVHVILMCTGMLSEAIADFGFIPSQWLRHDGVTLFTSMFLHVGIFHLIGNMYFLLMCGDDAEDILGHWKYFLLIILSEISAQILYMLTASDSAIPCVGASGFISGILAFYAITYPQATFSIFLPGRFRFFWSYPGDLWFSIPVWLWFTFYLLSQLLAAFLNTQSSTAYFAHLGGFIPGIIWAVIYRFFNSKK